MIAPHLIDRSYRSEIYIVYKYFVFPFNKFKRLKCLTLIATEKFFRKHVWNFNQDSFKTERLVWLATGMQTGRKTCLDRLYWRCWFRIKNKYKNILHGVEDTPCKSMKNGEQTRIQYSDRHTYALRIMNIWLMQIRNLF